MDKPLPEDAAIDAAHPLRSNRHDLYQEAMRLVGAKHSKSALVDLVNWLLLRTDTAETKARLAETEAERLRDLYLEAQPYVPDFFQKKWDLTVARANAPAEPPAPALSNACNDFGGTHEPH